MAFLYEYGLFGQLGFTFSDFSEFAGRQTLVKNFIRNRNGRLETVYRNISTNDSETHLAHFEFFIPTSGTEQTETYKNIILNAIDDMADNTSVTLKEIERKIGVSE